MHPLTFQQLVFTCVSAPPLEIAQFLQHRFTLPNPLRFGEPSDYRFETGDYTWHDACPSGPIQGWSPMRCVLWEPTNRPGHTAYITRSLDGNAFAAYRGSQVSPHEWVHVRLVDHLELAFQAVQFRYYHGPQRREIAAAMDEQQTWKFFQSGDPLPFENLTTYRRRRCKDRLNRSLVFEYLRAIGYDCEAEDFWQPREAILFWQESHTNDQPIEEATL